MSPYPLVEQHEDSLISANPPRPLPQRPGLDVPRAIVPSRSRIFAEALLEMSTTAPRHAKLDFLFSMTFHVLVLTLLVLLPLMYTESIDLRQLTQTLLVAPPPPPPPPPPPAAVQVQAAHTPQRVFMQAGGLVAPRAIPERVAMLKEEPLPPDVSLGVVGGVPGGVPGGQIGGVLGGILSDTNRARVPAPPSLERKVPVRVGGRVKPPQEVYAPPPLYPVLAKQARIQGDVLLDAIIDPQGRVVEMRVVSGHPLLIDAALEAVSKWRYQPSFLNDEAISVQLIVTVRFRLH